MQNLTDFIRHSDEQLLHNLGQEPGKYAYFNVQWENSRYEVHYVLNAKNEKRDWEMMAYAKLN